MPTPVSEVALQPGNATWVAVGAFERDNFGDLLLYQETCRYLDDKDRRLLAAAPFPGQTHDLLGEDVRAWGTVLSEQPADVVWTVGGAVGAVGIARAWSMSASPEQWHTYQAASPEERQAMLEQLQGTFLPPGELAYIPRLSQFPLNVGAISVANSIGMSKLTALPQSAREVILRGLREVSFLSVRDEKSREVCNSYGLEASLAPDIVHTIRFSLDPGELGVGPLIVQVSETQVDAVGVKNLADAVSLTSLARQAGVSVVCAGTARGHDSPQQAAQLVEALREREILADYLPERDPRAIAQRVATAAGYLGTSLHCRIVASAFGVPRVSLTNSKVRDYAQTWDEKMPFDVPIDELPAAIQQAVKARAEDDERGLALARQAEHNIRDLVTRAAGASSRRAAERRFALEKDHSEAVLTSVLNAWEESVDSSHSAQTKIKDKFKETVSR